MIPGEIDSPGYHTPGSYILADFLLTLRGMIPGEIDSPGYDTLGDWLAGVWCPGEIDLPGYDPPGSLTRQGMIPWEVRFSD